MEQKETVQDKTLGKEAEATTDEKPVSAAASVAGSVADDVADVYAKAKQELQESVSRLRYELSKLDVEAARRRARTWVEENPTLAVMLALGAGILAGRLLSQAFKPAPPPPLSDRIVDRSRSLATHARDLARGLGESVVEHAFDASDLLSRGAGAASDAVRQRARELGESVAQHAGDIAAAAVARANDWGDSAARSSRDAMHDLHETTHAASTAVRRRASHAGEFAESALRTVKTVLAAFIVKKVTDWIRRAG